VDPVGPPCPAFVRPPRVASVVSGGLGAAERSTRRGGSWRVDFADGFDTPEPLAWGLAPIQLGTVAWCVLATRSPLPFSPPVAVAPLLAGSRKSSGATLAPARARGRTLIVLGAAAAPTGPTTCGLLVVVQASDPPGPEGHTAHRGSGRDPRRGGRSRLTTGWVGQGRRGGTSVACPSCSPEPLTLGGARTEASRPESFLRSWGRPTRLLEVRLRSRAGSASEQSSNGATLAGWGWATRPPCHPGLTFFSLTVARGTPLAVEVAGCGGRQAGNAWDAVPPASSVDSI